MTWTDPTVEAGEGPTADASPWVFVLPGGDDDRSRCRRMRVPTVDVAGNAHWTLRRTPEGLLELRAPNSALRVTLDLARGPLARRLATARSDQPLPRAIGLHRRTAAPTVFDATAGLGRDALLLAHLGCRVDACERIPPLAMMLEDAAARAGLGERLRVEAADAVASLDERGAASVDVVLLDPMFPVHGGAQVKKEMQVCRLLAGLPGSTDALVHRAFAAARERVVIKRHPHELPLAGPPSFTVAGERVRFDVYLRPPRPTPAP